jgi:predicted nucleic acid-binding protein
MRIEPGEKVCLDTNVLLDTTDEGRMFHSKAQSVFAFLPANGVELFLPTQVVREYLVVATRPEKNNGLGLAIEDAVENVRQFRKRATVIPESVLSSRNLLVWSVRFQTSGKKTARPAKSSRRRMKPACESWSPQMLMIFQKTQA